MNKYSIKYNQLLERLQNLENVEIVESTPKIDHQSRYPEKGLWRLRNNENFDVEDEIVEMLKIPVTLSLYFIYPKHSFVGEFNFISLYNALTSLYDYKLYSESTHTKEQIEQLKHFSVIDDHPFSGDFKLSAFDKNPKTSPPKMPDIYFYDRGNYYKMNVDIFQYLDAMLDLAGMGNWQYLFCDAELEQWDYDHIFKDLKSGLLALKELFPEKDFSYYETLANKPMK